MCVYSSSLQLRKLSKEGKNRLSSCLASSFLLFWQIERFKTPRMWKSASSIPHVKHFSKFKMRYSFQMCASIFPSFSWRNPLAVLSVACLEADWESERVERRGPPKPFPFCPPPGRSLYPTHDPYMRHWKEGLGTHLPSPIKKTLWPYLWHLKAGCRVLWHFFKFHVGPCS